MKANVLVESSTGVHGLFVCVETEGYEGVYASTHIANYNNGSGLARIGDALDWAKGQLRECGYEVGKVQYNAHDDDFEIEVTKVQKKPKASEIRKALRPLLGDGVDSGNFDIYLEDGLGGNARVEFYGGVGDALPNLDVEVD